MTTPIDLASVSAITISGVPVKKVTVEGDTLWTPVPVNMNNQVPYTVPFPVVGEDAPPPPAALSLVSVTTDAISVAATGTPTEVGFGDPVGFNFYLDGTKSNVTADDDGLYTFTGLNDNTAYDVSFTFVNASAVESAQYGLRSVTTTAISHEVPTETASAIDGFVSAKIAPAGDPRWNGMIVGVKTGNWEYFKAYGTDRSQAMNTELNMRYGSITKIYTHQLAQMKVDQGLLSLNDKVSQYISGLQGDAGEATIKNLIMMQFGLKDFLQQDATVQQNYFLHPTTAIDPLSIIRSYTPWFPAGKVPKGWNPTGSGSYDNSATYLLGLILEAVDAEHGTGRDIRTIMTEDLLTPNGLTETEWPTTNYPRSPYSKAWTDNLALPTIQAMLGPLYPLAALLGYPTAEELEFTAVHPSYGGAAGDLDGTIRDLVKFGELLGSDTLLSPELTQLGAETFQTYLRYTPANPWDGPGWMGFAMGGWIQWAEWRVWIGNLGGYVSILWVNPNTGAVIAALGNNIRGAIPIVDLGYRIAYLLDPDSTLTAPNQTIRPKTIPSSQGWVGKPGVYVYHEPTNEVPAEVPMYI